MEKTIETKNEKFGGGTEVYYDKFVGEGDRFKLITVELAPQGKFVRIFLRKNSQSMILSATVWDKLCVKIEDINLEGKADDVILFTLAVPRFSFFERYLNGYPIIGIYETKVPGLTDRDDSISFNVREVKKLRRYKDAVSEVVHRPFIYRQTSPRLSSKWHIDKMAAAFVPPNYKSDSPVKLDRKLIAMPPMREIVLMITSYVLTEKIIWLRSELCFGCANNRPGQKDHMEKGSGCLTDWSENVTEYLEEARRTVAMEPEIQKVKEHLGWPLEDFEFSPDEITDSLNQRYSCNHKYCKSETYCFRAIIGRMCGFLKVGIKYSFSHNI